MQIDAKRQTTEKASKFVPRAKDVNSNENVSDSSIKRLSAKDNMLSDVFTSDFLERFEVHSYRNASRILATASATDLAELIDTLMSFQIRTEDIVKPGGNKSRIAKNMDDLLFPKGWYESRIRGDLTVSKTTVLPNVPSSDEQIKKGEKKSRATEQVYRIDGFIDGHKIDFVKNRVAFDMEWNSKDQTFDRDLYAVRTFYECGIIDAGVLLTRSKALAPIFVEIGKRVDISNFKSKYGASTTWMGKLLYRLDAGRGGGCPVLAIGIKPSVIVNFKEWKSAHPPIKTETIDADDLTDESDEQIEYET